MPLIRSVHTVSIVLVSAAIALLIFATALFSLTIGSTGVSLHDVVSILLSAAGIGASGASETIQTIVLNIRLPRILLSLLVGGSLAVSGVVFQVLLRNPLAEPFILGVSSGASVGALVAIATGISAALLGGTTILAFLGAAAVIGVVYFFGSRRGVIESGSLLLSGVMTGAFLSAIILLLVALIGDRARNAIFWILGNLNAPIGAEFAIAAPILLLCLILIGSNARRYNLIALGEEVAGSLGVPLKRTRNISYLAASLITGIVVSFSGAIGFVGLIVPHASRLLFGPDHRMLLPSSFLLGALFLLAADTISRTLLYPAELPVGAVTALIGAPLFIILLKLSD